MLRQILLSLTILCCLLFSPSILGQVSSFQTTKGEIPIAPNADQITNIDQIGESEIFNQRFYRFIQFNEIPTVKGHAALTARGIELTEYISNNVYLASIPVNIDFKVWKSLNIRGLVSVPATLKVGQRIEDKDYPEWAIRGNSILLSLRYHADISPQVAKQKLTQLNIEVTEYLDQGQIAIAKVAKNQIHKLSKEAFVRYISIIAEPGVPESEDGRNLHSANTIDGDYYGARNYDGTGVTMAINDDGFVGPHIDFKGRTNQTDVAGDFTGTHGDMTTGIAVGAGNLDPLVRGMATGSRVFVRQYSANMGGTAQLHQDSAILVFSSSYSNGCNAGYTNTTFLVDKEIYDNPNLMQVFSAGNSNNQNCGYGAGTQWGNVTGGHKIGKNVIATANLNNMDVIANSSSRGPASDGRIKPDISAHGVDHYSTDPDNQYAPGGGTSAACPGIAGVFTQLNHAFKEMNGGIIAPSALLKLALLVTASDLGNDGPDFIFGWGKVNALRSVNLLEENRYFLDTVSQAGNKSHTITIPAGVKRARIMVYWADKEASTNSTFALLSNLDCQVTDPSNVVHLPWILDHTPNATSLGLAATRGIDSINNMEQIAIDNPAAGSYTLDISGTSIPFGNQEYYVAYEFLTEDITVVHPQGGEGIIPGVSNRVHWDAYGDSGPFTVEFTDDDGTTWNLIGTSTSNSDRFMNWAVPNSLTGQARVRVTRGTSADESDANFSIMERPQNLDVTGVCHGASTFRAVWDSVPGATGYDVFLLGSKFMDSIGGTSNFNFDIPVSSLTVDHWYSVRATGPNGLRSLRQIAKKYDGAGSCYVDCISPDDAGIKSLDEPANRLSSCGGLSSSPVTVTLENLGNATQSNFPVSYQLDNGTVVNETFTGTIAAGGTASYTFTAAMSLPAQGNHTLRVWTGLAADLTSCNDTITEAILMQPSSAILPFVEDIQGTVFPPMQAYIENPDSDLTWEKILSVRGASGINTSAIWMDNFGYNASGEEDFFYTIPIDLINATEAKLTFDVSYREYSANNSDKMRVDISDDCGATFSQIFFKDGDSLATGPATTNRWIPTRDSDWRMEVVDLDSYIGKEVILRFVNICDYGNNLYLDNINVHQGLVGLNEKEDDLEWSIHPNPVRDHLVLSFDEVLTENMEVTLISPDGKLILKDQVQSGSRTMTLTLSDLASGIYLVKLQSQDEVSVREVMVID